LQRLKAVREVTMNARRTVTEMLDTLRGQIDFHRGQEMLHAQQESLQSVREGRAYHEALYRKPG
jgi:hypothetical protein